MLSVCVIAALSFRLDLADRRGLMERERFWRTLGAARLLHAGQTADFYPHHMDAESGAELSRLTGVWLMEL